MSDKDIKEGDRVETFDLLSDGKLVGIVIADKAGILKIELDNGQIIVRHRRRCTKV